MKKLLFSLLAVIFSVSLAFAGGSSNTTCQTKYPIVLCHGMGASATIAVLGVPVVQYWYNIPSALEADGAKVYVTSVNGMDSTANKAASVKAQILQIMAVTGASKVNIIGHSHGTIYTRYMITNLGMASKVASYTSLCGPHRGSSVADFIFKIVPQSGWSLLGGTLDMVYAVLFGDNSPNSLANGIQVTRPYMNNTFNPNTPNVAGLYYQSWASKIKYCSNSVILEIPWLIGNYYEGDFDGLVAVTSAKWGNFRGTIEGAWWAGGVDHLNMVNQLFGVTPGFDSPAFFVGMVQDLKSRGY